MYIKLGYSPNESWDPDNSKYVWQHGSVEKKPYKNQIKHWHDSFTASQFAYILVFF